MKYAFLKTCLDSKLIGRRKLISVRKAAALLRISTSGYYQWLKVDRYHRHGVHHSDAELLCHVRSVISRCGKQVPGVMRLYLALRQLLLWRQLECHALNRHQSGNRIVLFGRSYRVV